MININAQFLAHTAKATRKDEEALKYVSVEPFNGGAILAATNGRSAIFYFDEKRVCEGGQKLVKVGDDILKAALKKANAGTRMEFDDNGTCTFKQKSGAVLHQENCVDSATQYPDYRKFLEKAKGFGQHPVFPTCLPMEQLNVLLLNRDDKLVFYQTDCHGPVYVRNFWEASFLGIIMPMYLRNSEGVFVNPETGIVFDTPLAAWADMLISE